jgi:hypothetical protein
MSTKKARHTTKVIWKANGKEVFYLTTLLGSSKMSMEIGLSGLLVYVTADQVSSSASVYLPHFLSNHMPQKELRKIKDFFLRETTIGKMLSLLPYAWV